MEESSNDLRKTLAKDPLTLSNINSNNRASCRRSDRLSDDSDHCDGEAWETLSSGIERVQSVLDQNRALIQQVNENQQSKIPDNLLKNVALIREINRNINKVVCIYSDLSVNFTDLVRERKAMSKNSNGNVRSTAGGGGKGGNDVVDAAAVQ